MPWTSNREGGSVQSRAHCHLLPKSPRQVLIPLSVKSLAGVTAVLVCRLNHHTAQPNSTCVSLMILIEAGNWCWQNTSCFAFCKSQSSLPQREALQEPHKEKTKTKNQTNENFWLIGRGLDEQTLESGKTPTRSWTCNHGCVSEEGAEAGRSSGCPC